MASGRSRSTHGPAQLLVRSYGLPGVSLFSEPTKGAENRAKTAGIRNKGKEYESELEFQPRASGREIVRTGRGSDCRVRERQPWTGTVTTSTLVEEKSGEAKLPELQRKTKKKRPRRYRVVHQKPIFGLG